MLLKNFSDIYGYVSEQVKGGTSNLDQIKDRVNFCYQRLATEHKWKFLKTSRDIFVPIKYTTGTISITSGDRVVTGASTVWTEYMVGMKILIGNVSQYVFEIISVDTAAQTLVLSERYSGTTVTLGSYTIYKDEFGLPPDLFDINTITHSFQPYLLTKVTPTQLSRMVALSPLTTGKATYFTIDGYCGYDGPPWDSAVWNNDFWGGDDINVVNLKLYPSIPDANYILHLDYFKQVEELINDTDEPLIPLNNRVILVYGAISEFASLQRDEVTSAIYDRKYKDELKKLASYITDTDDSPKFVVPDRWSRNRSGQGSSFQIDWEKV